MSRPLRRISTRASMGRDGSVRSGRETSPAGPAEAVGIPDFGLGGNPDFFRRRLGRGRGIGGSAPSPAPLERTSVPFNKD
jgi:hypothetical protein